MCDTFRSFLVLCILLISSLENRVDSLQTSSVKEFREAIVKDKYVMVLFSKDDSTCARCLDAEKQLENVQKPEMFESDIIKMKVEDASTGLQYGVTSAPQIVFFRQGDPVLYEIPEDSGVILTEDVNLWLDTAKDIATKILNEDSFEHLTQASTGATTGDWLVIFFDSSCQSYLPAIEGAAIQLKQRMNVAKVNIEENSALAKRFDIKECPTTYFLRLGKMYLYFSEEKERYDIKSLRHFASNWYKNVKAEKVPGIPTMFDKLTDSIAENLKLTMNSPNRNKFLIGAAVVMAIIAFVVSLVVVLCAKKKDKESHDKTE